MEVPRPTGFHTSQSALLNNCASRAAFTASARESCRRRIILALKVEQIGSSAQLKVDRGCSAKFLILTKVRPASDINALPSHTTVKATTGRKEQFKTVAHPAAHAEEGLSSKKRGQR